MMMEGVIKDVFRKFNEYPVPVSASVIAERDRCGSGAQNLTIRTGKP